jgi:hypothetical protein
LWPKFFDWYFRKPIRHKLLLVGDDNKPSVKITLYRLFNTFFALAYLFVRVVKCKDEAFLSKTDFIAGGIGIGSVFTSPYANLLDSSSQLYLAWMGRK